MYMLNLTSYTCTVLVGYGVTANIAASQVKIAAARGSIPRIRKVFVFYHIALSFQSVGYFSLDQNYAPILQQTWLPNLDPGLFIQ